MAAGLRPNPKAVERLARRLKARPGVTRVARAQGGKSLSFTARTVRAVEARRDGETVFHETGLIYLRASVGLTGPLIGVHLSAISFCAHALERLTDLRRALKRGRAREAFAHAAAADADMAAIVDLGTGLRPNPRSQDRVARRLAHLPGFVSVTRGTDGRLVVLVRYKRHVVTWVAGDDAFAEDALLYIRVDIAPVRERPRFGLIRASFCLHDALEAPKTVGCHLYSVNFLISLIALQKECMRHDRVNA